MLYYRSLPNLKQKYACIISQLLKVEQKSRSSLARRFWVFHVVVIKITAGLHSSEGSQDSFSHMVDRHLWLCHGAAWMSLQHGSWLPWEQVLRERGGQMLRCLLRSRREVTYHHFHRILLVTQVSSIPPSYTKTLIPESRDHGAILEMHPTGNTTRALSNYSFIHWFLRSFI